MAQGKAVYSSFPRDGACSGLELPNPAYVDSVDRYTPEQYPTSYHAMRSTIIEAAQASGELQPLTEAEMERRTQQEAKIEHFLREARRAEIYGRNLPAEKTRAALQKLEQKTVPTFGFLYSPQGDMVAFDHSRFDSMNPADWRVVCCDVGGEPLMRQATHVWQLTRDAFGAIGLVPDDATARIVVITASERGTMQYLIDCYDGKSPLVTAVETPNEGGDRTVTPYLADWSRSGAAMDEMDRSNPQDNLDLLQGNGGVVQAA